MHFKQYDVGCLAHASYVIGDESEAAVVDLGTAHHALRREGGEWCPATGRAVTRVGEQARDQSRASDQLRQLRRHRTPTRRQREPWCVRTIAGVLVGSVGSERWIPVDPATVRLTPRPADRGATVSVLIHF
jgi:hypothetical protein